jgi:hypothetical protein
MSPSLLYSYGQVGDTIFSDSTANSRWVDAALDDG